MVERNRARDRIAGIGDEAVQAATGKTWAQWCKALDKDGAKSMPHKEIARLVVDKYGLPPWWSQMVTVGYEQARGLRKPHETAAGYQAGVSKTVNAPVGRLFAAWKDAKSRSPWLGRRSFTVRKATKDKSLRITWPDDTSVEVNFYAKGPGKSQVTIQHGKLDGASQVKRMKALWSGALGKLKEQLEKSASKPVRRKAAKLAV